MTNAKQEIYEIYGIGVKNLKDLEDKLPVLVFEDVCTLMKTEPEHSVFLLRSIPLIAEYFKKVERYVNTIHRKAVLTGYSEKQTQLIEILFAERATNDNIEEFKKYWQLYINKVKLETRLTPEFQKVEAYVKITGSNFHRLAELYYSSTRWYKDKNQS